MYKYTPKASVLRDMIAPKTGNWHEKEYFKRKAILKSYGAGDLKTAFAMENILDEHFDKVCFYSLVKLKSVPVQGYQFPVEMFDEVKV